MRKRVGTMAVKYGAYLVLPLKYEKDGILTGALEADCIAQPVTTMDLSENVKNMLRGQGEQSVGQTYRLPRERLLEQLCGGAPFSRCRVTDEGMDYSFDLLDSYVYVFHTRIAFLCLGVAFSDMQTLYAICNPGYADNDSAFVWLDGTGAAHEFSLGPWLESLCARWGLGKFHDGPGSMLLEAYTFILALTDRRFTTLEQLRQVTFNLHQMQDIGTPVEDDSEEDIRYVYAVKNPTLQAYRWGCCVASQTISYVVTDPALDFQPEMDTQAADGLPLVMLALYEKYTCLRFTQLIAQPETRKLKPMQELKRLMLRFQAFGTVAPANLSRWNNVKQIYAYLLEVCDTANAVEDIGTKVEILAQQQQELQNKRTERVVNLITVFGIVGIIGSVQGIVSALTDASQLMWGITGLTAAVLAVCFGLALRK